MQAPVLYLRPFANLRSLSLSGNPLCRDEGHETYLIAYLPQLRYLDYKRISSENVYAPLMNSITVLIHLTAKCRTRTVSGQA